MFQDWTIFEERNYINRIFSLVPDDSISSLILQDANETQFGDSLKTTKGDDLLIAHTDPAPPNTGGWSNGVEYAQRPQCALVHIILGRF